MLKKAKYSSEEHTDFIKDLKSRVEEYFKKNQISKRGNFSMYFKTVVLLALYFVPFVLLFLPGWSNLEYFLLWGIMGAGLAGCGLSIMHDAAHGSYSHNQSINNVLSYLLNVIGGNSFNWKMQHNVLHHTYTNVDDLDEDIDPGVVMRFSPNKKYYSVYKAQFLYGWFLYGLMTLMWCTVKDFKQLVRYKKKGLLKGEKKYRKEMTILVVSKVLYFSYILVLPIMVTDYPWYKIVVGMLLMHFVGGLILSCVFQPAHVMESSQFPLPNDENILNDKWEVHQLKTTANFAQKSRLLSWYMGGLNYQIEHHLFPKICHIHYKEISKIVKATAEEHGLPYTTHGNFVSTLWYHGKMLKKLGQRDFKGIALQPS